MKAVNINLKDVGFYKDTDCKCIIKVQWLSYMFFYKSTAYKVGPGCIYNNNISATHTNYFGRIPVKYKKLYFDYRNLLEHIL